VEPKKDEKAKKPTAAELKKKQEEELA